MAIDLGRLSPALRKTLVEAVMENGGHDEGWLRCCTPNELMDIWLKWEGIHGYTYQIIQNLDAFRNAQIE